MQNNTIAMTRIKKTKVAYLRFILQNIKRFLFYSLSLVSLSCISNKGGPFFKPFQGLFLTATWDYSQVARSDFLVTRAL